jgi:hypothetical protein
MKGVPPIEDRGVADEKSRGRCPAGQVAAGARKTPRDRQVQLLRDVWVWIEVKRCVTFLLLHLGQPTRFLSRSENVMIKVNFFLQAIQVYSYVGIPSPSFTQRIISSHHVGAYGRNYISATLENDSGGTRDTTIRYICLFCSSLPQRPYGLPPVPGHEGSVEW